MITLAIETSAAPASISLLNNEELIEEVFIENQKETSALISQKIHNLLFQHLSSPNQVDRIAVGLGPGSYTGLRVGLATAKGLVLALDKPLEPVDSLQAFAMQAYSQVNDSETIMSLFDARGGKVFIGEYNIDGTIITKPHRTTLDALSKLDLSKKIACFVPSLEQNIKKLKFLSYKKQILLSSYVGLCSLKYTKNLSLQKIAYTEPYYLINNYINKH